MNKDEFQRLLKGLFDEVPFHKHLGMEIISFGENGLNVRLAMRPELVGNQIKQILHGGVIASVIDAVGGFSGAASAYETMMNLPADMIEKKLKNFSTMDMHVDFLSPGDGECFEAVGIVLKSGGKRIVTRVEVKDDKGGLLAVGTGNYLY